MITVLILFITLFLYAPLGKRLVKDNVYVRSLVGVSITGLAVGIAANLCSAVIPFIIYGFLTLSVVLGGIDFFKNISFIKYSNYVNINKIRPILFNTIIFGSVFVFIYGNLPLERFLLVNGNEYITFNGHDSYFGGQVIEMFNAEYFGRLKISNQVFSEWSKYHFFNSACIASIMALLPNPFLESYRGSILVLGSFGFLIISSKILEFCKQRTFFDTFLIFISSTLMLLSLFYPSYQWSTKTTGFFAFIGIFCLISTLFLSNNKEACIFIIIIASSSIRSFFAISSGILAFLFLLCFYRKINFKLPIYIIFSFSKTVRSNVWVSSFCVLAFIYNGVTLIFGNPPLATGGRSPYLDGWGDGNPTMIVKSAFFYFFRNVPWTSWRPFGDFVCLLFLVLGMLLIFLSIWLKTQFYFFKWLAALKLEGKNYNPMVLKISHISLFLPIGFFLIQLLFFPTKAKIFDLFCLLPLCTCLFLCLLLFNSSLRFRQRRMYLVLSCLIGVLLGICCFAVIPVSLKGALAAADTNAYCYSIFLIFFIHNLSKRYIYLMALVSVFLFICFPPRIFQFYIFDPSDGHSVLINPNVINYNLYINKRRDVVAANEISNNPYISDYLALKYGFRLSGSPYFLTSRFLDRYGSFEKIYVEVDPDLIYTRELLKKTINEGKSLQFR